MPNLSDSSFRESQTDPNPIRSDPCSNESRHGIGTAADYPYTGWQGVCRASKVPCAVMIDGYDFVPSNNEEALKKAVAYQPVSVGLASREYFPYYKKGVLKYHSRLPLDHDGLVVGYGTTSDGTKYWIVKNSWGPNWGEGGYIRTERDHTDKGGQCGIARDPSYPIIIPPNLKSAKDA